MQNSNRIANKNCKAQNQMFPYLISHLFVFCSFQIQFEFDCNGKPVKQTFTQIYNCEIKFSTISFYCRCPPPSHFHSKNSVNIAYVCKHSIYSFNTNVYLPFTIEMRFIQDGFPINILVDFIQFYNFDHVRYLRVHCTVHTTQTYMPNA